jgi:hypothetical protein
MYTDRTTKVDAQERADRIRAFQQELSALQAKEILVISEPQRRQIDCYHESVLATLKKDYDIDHNQATKQLSLGMKIVSLVGALAMASSIFFVFFQFWGMVSTFTQTAVLVGSSIITFIAVYAVAKIDASGYYSKIVGLIALACLVLNLVMFGQMFAITPSPNAFIIWALYGFLLAYLCKARVLLVLAILSLSCFFSMYFSTWSGVYFINFGEHPENILMSSLIIFCLPFAFTQMQNTQRFGYIKQYEHFNKVYRVMGLLLFFLPVLLLSNWGRGSYLALDHDTIEGMYQLLGFLAAGLTIWLGIVKQWRHVNITGNIFFVLFLYTKFFDWWWDWLPKYVFFFAIGLFSIVLLVMLKRLRVHHNDMNSKTLSEGARA